MDETKLMSNAFQTFSKETPQYSKAWMEAVQKLDTANAMDKKTKALAYLAVLAASGLVSGIPFHVQHAKSLGASNREDLSTVLIKKLIITCVNNFQNSLD